MASTARFLLRPEDAWSGLGRGLEAVRLSGRPDGVARRPGRPSGRDAGRAERGPRLSLAGRRPTRETGGYRAAGSGPGLRSRHRLLADQEDIHGGLSDSRDLLAPRASRFEGGAGNLA